MCAINLEIMHVNGSFHISVMIKYNNHNYSVKYAEWHELHLIIIASDILAVCNFIQQTSYTLNTQMVIIL